MYYDIGDSSENEATIKVGAKRWTRIVSDVNFQNKEPVIYSVPEEVKFDKACRSTPFKHQVNHHEILFDPQSTKADTDRLKVDDYKLST